MIIIIIAHNSEDRILGLAPETQGRTLFTNKSRRAAKKNIKNGVHFFAARLVPRDPI